jgi:hypothetical protein
MGGTNLVGSQVKYYQGISSRLTRGWSAPPKECVSGKHSPKMPVPRFGGSTLKPIKDRESNLSRMYVAGGPRFLGIARSCATTNKIFFRLVDQYKASLESDAC